MKHMNSLGNRSDRNISIKYRSAHPSYVGRLDLNSCSSSSPGLSGVVCPFTTTNKLWFNDNNEAETVEYEMVKAQDEYFTKDDNLHIKYDLSSPTNYYKSLMSVRDYLSGCELINPLEGEENLADFYPINPNGPLLVRCGFKEDTMMKPIVL